MGTGKPWWRHWGLRVAGALLAAAAVAVGVLLRQAEPLMRAGIISAVENRFHARVELDGFSVSLMRGLEARGTGLRIWPPAEVAGVTVPPGQGEPLVSLEEFDFRAPLEYRPGMPIHLSVVELKGLTVHLPPRSHFEHRVDYGVDRGLLTVPIGGVSKPAMPAMVRFELDTLECTGAELVVETSKPGKLPQEFAIDHARVTHIAEGGAMGFEAELTNPRPLGTVRTTGSFGPWETADPGESPLNGEYRLEDADLGSFKEIGGRLNSTGNYAGTLRDLVVDGEAETKDFRLTHFGNALPLKTRFHAQVDGTNGDTLLEPVEATLGQSHFWARGQIVRVAEAAAAGEKPKFGHDITMAVDVDRARIEDFLRLAGRTDTVLLTGDLKTKAKLHIPPGKAPMHERLSLEGRFALDRARFASAKVQGRIAELSLRGQGRPDDLKTTDAGAILSALNGRFALGGGVLSLPELQYTVPGATVQLQGSYALEGGALKFDGSARMDATVSKMVGGWKGFLLKPADRYFRKEGAGTLIRIHIDGTRDEPRFGIDFGRVKSTIEVKP